MRQLLLSVLVVQLVWLGSAEAQSPPKQSLNYRNLTALRLNPLGLVNASALNYQYRLYESDNPLYQTNYAGLTFQPLLSPAYVRIGGGVEVQPLSVLRLSAMYEQVKFFGILNFLQSYPDATGDWSDTAQDENGDDGYAAGGSQITLGALLQAKVGSIAARSNLRLMKFQMDLNDGDQTWYDPMLDALLPAEGWGFTNDLDVIYVTNIGWIIGLRDTITTAWHEGDDPNPISHRVGPLLSYQIMTDPGQKVDSISAFFVMNWYLSHRYRTGEDVGQGIPYLAAGLTITGQLF